MLLGMPSVIRMPILGTPALAPFLAVKPLKWHENVDTSQLAAIHYMEDNGGFNKYMLHVYTTTTTFY
jgi:hypothetical protein